MPEQDPTKGFRIIDKRRLSDEERDRETAPEAPLSTQPPPASPRPERKAAPAPPPPAGPRDPGNRPAGERVDTGKGPGGEPQAVGGPTFLDLIGTLQLGAMIHLGMLQGQDGRRSPVNIPAAKDSIDMLSLLQEKTKGNLTPEEADVLAEGLYHVRMAYMAALKAAAPGPGGKNK
jgi:hypothetical protein